MWHEPLRRECKRWVASSVAGASATKWVGGSPGNGNTRPSTGRMRGAGAGRPVPGDLYLVRRRTMSSGLLAQPCGSIAGLPATSDAERSVFSVIPGFAEASSRAPSARAGPQHHQLAFVSEALTDAGHRGQALSGAPPDFRSRSGMDAETGRQ